jgi:hypothetical protein
MAFIGIRKLDTAVCMVNKISTNPAPDAYYYEVEKNPIPKFAPKWQLIMWIYDIITDTFTNTGLPMTWPDVV